MLVSELKNEDGTYNHNSIEVNPFIGFIEKKILCLNVLENCMDVDENGMVVCDFFLRKLVRDINIVKQYTNIEISDNEYISEYDFLVQNGIIKFILDGVNKSELDFIDEMIEREAEQRIKVCNSIEGILASKFEKVINKIPDSKELKSLSKSIVKDINKLDQNKIGELKKIFSKVN